MLNLCQISPILAKKRKPVKQITKPLKTFRMCLAADILCFVGRHFCDLIFAKSPDSTPFGCSTYGLLIEPHNFFPTFEYNDDLYFLEKTVESRSAVALLPFVRYGRN
jgi:hypothetical protein